MTCVDLYEREQLKITTYWNKILNNNKMVKVALFYPHSPQNTNAFVDVTIFSYFVEHTCHVIH